jgi:hypothetical protein
MRLYENHFLMAMHVQVLSVPHNVVAIPSANYF